MKNYTEMLKTVETKTNLETVVTEYNKNILDNVATILDKFELEKAVDRVNANYAKSFVDSFLALYETDRKTAFLDLIASPNFPQVGIETNENGTLFIKDKKAVFKFANLEKAYQVSQYKETDKNGKPKSNTAVTVFGALRFYGLCESFIRNLLINTLTVDETKKVDISQVTVDNVKIFTEKDGECFGSTSNKALTQQLNILVKFFDIDVEMLRKDLPILKLSAQRVKRNTENRSSIKESNVLKFADVLFSVVTSRYQGKDIEVVLNKSKKA